MRQIIAITQVSVDGVMQAPGGPEEDPSDGFAHEGHIKCIREGKRQWVGEIVASDAFQAREQFPREIQIGSVEIPFLRVVRLAGTNPERILENEVKR